MSVGIDLERAMEAARRAAEAGGAAAMAFFRRDPRIETKADGTFVTEADEAAERAIVEIIREAFPDHALLTEESGASGDQDRPRWIVDPLDGTHRFARGLPFWGPLVALQAEGRVLAGGFGLPTQGEVYWGARGLGAWRNGERLAVSSRRDWPTANLSCGALARLFESKYGEGVRWLIDTSEYTVAGSDLAGCAVVLKGQAEAWLELGVQVWDIAPFAALIEEAGGRFTDMEGEETIESGNAVATNGALHELVLDRLQSGAD